MILRAVMASDVALIQGAADAFTDDDGSPHEMDINILAATGVILGRADGTFDPKASITRAEVAALVARAYKLITGDPLATGPNAFTDDNNSVHLADINAVAAAGWVKGVGVGLFNPDGDATRAQLATILTRMLSTWSMRERLRSPASRIGDRGGSTQARPCRLALLRDEI